MHAERWLSGRKRTPGERVSGVSGFEGSNPSLSATEPEFSAALQRARRRDERPNLMIEKLKAELSSLKNPEKAAVLKRFFKTGNGQYGEGDIFLGIQVPVLRKTAKKYYSMHVSDILEVLKSSIHEERMVALFMLVHKYEKGDEGERGNIYQEYLKNTEYINNWDLVDLTAEKIVGEYLFNRPKEPLYKLAESGMLWEIGRASCRERV